MDEPPPAPAVDYLDSGEEDSKRPFRFESLGPKVLVPGERRSIRDVDCPARATPPAA